MLVIDHIFSEREFIKKIAGSLSIIHWMGGFTKPEDALVVMMQNPPDVVIISIELPGTNGLSFTHKLQELLPRTHVIVTARSSQFAREAYEVGARGYLIKPIERVSLVRLLENIRTNHLN